MMNHAAKIWEETVLLPTYPAAEPEKYPLFIEKRAYQGSTGKVYPLPVTEKVSDVCREVAYHAVWLENEYLRVMVLPELGGRIHRALDKTNGYDFVYYNHVVKPALVGLTGPWISGGIEFNWPQHHRPTTFSPVDYRVAEHDDGSVTVYVGETDKMYGTKGMAAISLYPGKAYLEIRGRLYNPTDLPQTFLWWANPAVPVNDHTYSVFPPDVNAVMDHGRRAVSTFPIATGEYYKCDYSAGVDISRYKNVPVPTSYMAAHSDFDFAGNYDESRQAGLLHVADHHVAPGKKQWTWGNGDFGRAWDRNLTDADGPYIELMTGVFTDNQPDFSWLKPQEEKTFVQYFLPYKGVGRVGNATRDAAVGLQLLPDGRGEVRVYVTGEQPGAVIRVQRGGDCLYEARADLSPQGWFGADFAADGTLHDCEVTVEAGDRTLVRYRMYEPELRPIPAPAEPLGAPEELRTTEELYLAATHLEQYRHATRDPADYYREGLRRDPTDLRLNDGYGLLLFRQGQIRQSIACFEKAVQKQTWKNPNPYQGACFFHLGLALEADGQHRKAYDAFYKSTWSAETQSAGFYWLACLEARRGNLEQALEFVGLSLVRNWHNMNGRCLKAALLRHLGRDNTALLAESLAIDPLQMGCLYEESRRTGTPEVWRTVMRQEAHNYLDLALHYAKAGLLEEAVEILQACPEQSPMPSYYEGYLHGLAGDEAAARACCLRAEHLPAPRCYPNRVEEIAILEYAIRLLGRAPRAHALLGCLLYDKKQADAAIAHWEASVQQDPGQALVHRNLAIARYNKQGDADAALREMEQARRLDPGYPRLLLEYDQLAARLGRSNAARLQLLEENLALVEQRDDLMLRYVTLLNCEGRCEEALQILLTRRFHPWEGGEGKVSAQYRYALIRLAKDCLNRGENDRAVQLLEQSKTYPDTLGEGKLPNVPDNEADYWQGVALRAMGREPEAAAAFLRAASGPQEPGRVLYYNDQPSDFIYYQGLAQRAMGNEAAARKAFHKLLTYGETHLFDAVAYDFFAVSLPEIEVFADDIALRNRQYCNYLRALGCAGLGRTSEAAELFAGILELQPDDQGALRHA